MSTNDMKNCKIITTFIYPPIPLRNYDWEAFREDYDIGYPVGHGPTEEAAIKDLKEKEES